MPLRFQYGDITTLTTDAIVNAANEKLQPGTGVCGAIFQAAGSRLELSCSRIGTCPVGQAVITPGFALPAKYIIHTVGPVWQGGDHGEAEALASCYRESIQLAREAGCDSVAFPLISAGNFGYPPVEALKVAVSTIHESLKEADLQVVLVFLHKEAFVLEDAVRQPAHSFMKSRGLEKAFEDTTYRHTFRMVHRAGYGHMPGLEMPADDRELLQQELVQESDFARTLVKLMADRNMSLDELRWRSNMTLQRLNAFLREQMPTKSQAMALALALRLNMDYTRQLLVSARLFLDATEDQDLLVEYCIAEERFDVLEANQLLFSMGIPQLIW